MRELAATLRAGVEEAAVRLRHLTETEVTWDRGAGKWIKKEVLGHIIDSAVNNHQRFVRAQTVDPFVWPGYDQQFWVSVHRYRDRPWAELVELWVGLNCHVAQIIEGVPPVRLSARCVIGDAEPATLEWWMRDYLRHLRHHLAQIEGD